MKLVFSVKICLIFEADPEFVGTNRTNRASGLHHPSFEQSLGEVLDPAARQSCSSSTVRPTYFVYPVPQRYYSMSQVTESIYNGIGTEQYKLEYLLPQFFNSSCLEAREGLADYYIVPFLPVSLYLKNKRSGKGVETVRNNFALLIEYITNQFPYWRRFNGSDHVFIFASGRSSGLLGDLQDKLRHSVFISPEANPRGGYFNPLNGLVVPGYQKQRNSRRTQTKYFAFFKGSIVSKNPDESDYSRGIRLVLFNRTRDLLTESEIRLNIKSRVVYGATSMSTQAYFRELRRSIFCICPRGSSSWTMRVFHSVNMGCVPVIISDDVILPFQHLVSWPEIAIFIPEKYAEYIYYFLYAVQRKFIKRARALMQNVRPFLNYYKGSQTGAMEAIHSSLQRLKATQTAYVSKPLTGLDFSIVQQKNNTTNYFNRVPAFVFARQVDCVLPFVLHGLATKLMVSSIDVLMSTSELTSCHRLLLQLQLPVTATCGDESQHAKNISDIDHSWYPHQLLKLLHVYFSRASTVLIWDADTIPLNGFALFTPEGRPILISGTASYPVYLQRNDTTRGIHRNVRDILEMERGDGRQSCAVQFQVWNRNMVGNLLRYIGKGNIGGE